MAFGETNSGNPLTTLDIVAHELMHGITHFGVSQRSPGGLESGLEPDGLGPTGISIDGQFVPCSNLIAISPDGTRFPFLCSAGRFVLVSNHGRCDS